MTFNPQPKPEKKEPEKISIYEFRKKYTGKQIKAKSKRKTKKFPSAQDRFYKSNAWLWCRRYIITLYCDPKTMTVPNYTGTGFLPLNGKNTQVGHFVRVFEGNNTHMSTAFDERNLLPQNYADNVYHGGKQDMMSVQIDLIHGQGTSAELVRKSLQFKKYTDSELKEVAETFKNKTYKLLEEKKLKKWWIKR